MCTQRLYKKKRRGHKRVHPSQTRKSHPKPPPPTFTVDEQIECQGCHQSYPLVSENEEQGIKIHCAGCNQFFHCQIAGTCCGTRCSQMTTIGTIHRLSWCVHCVPTCAMNKAKKNRDETCICTECMKDA